MRKSRTSDRDRGTGPKRSRRATTLLEAWALDRLLPDAQRDSGELDGRQARLLVLSSLAILPWALVYALAYGVLFAAWTTAAFLFGATLAVVLALPLLRLSASVVVAGNWLAAVLYVAAVYCSYRSGGMYGVALPWIAVVPLFAYIFAGMRSAMAWVILAIATCLGFYLGTRMGFPFIRELSPPEHAQMYTLGLLGLSVVVSTLFALHTVMQRWLVRSLADQGEGLRALIESLPEGVAVHREDEIIFANRALAEMLGYGDPEELVGKSPLEFVPDSNREDVRSRLSSLAARGGANEPDERPVVRKDGGTVMAEVRALAAPIAGEETMISMMRDVTERNQLQSQLMQVDRVIAVGTLASGVAHEINNPLTYVLGNIDWLIAELERDPSVRADGAELREVLDDLSAGAHQIRRIVSDLSTYARPRVKGRASAKVGEVVEFTLKMVDNHIRHRARVEIDLEDLPPVAIDEAGLGQVLLNLCVNAAQAIPAGAASEHRVRVASYLRGDEVVVEVSDTGSGMSEETRRRAFDPFFTTKPPTQGSGLGLPICHNIVSAAGGRITVDSAPGRGTTIRVSLPVARARGATAREAPVGASEARLRVLVVDDDSGVQASLERNLSKRFDVCLAMSGREALDRLGGAEGYDIVLCDLMMPDLSGADLYRILADRDPDLAARVVFMTGGAFSEDEENFAADAPQPVLTKPLDFEELAATLRAVAARKDP